MSNGKPGIEDMTDEQREEALKRHRANIKGPLLPDDEADVLEIDEVIGRFEADSNQKG